MLSRDEFIEGYMARSAAAGAFDAREVERTPDGFKIDGWERIALPCACGEDECEGWAMLTNEPDQVRTHTELYAP
jgi:hypothetical protein